MKTCKDFGIETCSSCRKSSIAAFMKFVVKLIHHDEIYCLVQYYKSKIHSMRKEDIRDYLMAVITSGISATEQPEFCKILWMTVEPAPHEYDLQYLEIALREYYPEYWNTYKKMLLLK